MQKRIEVSRQQLYQEVWAEPARVVARRYGVSDVALGKICKAYDIPKPWPGYWAQRQHRKVAAVAPPLPAATSLDMERLFFHGEGATPNYADAPEYARERHPDWRIEVPGNLRVSHPLVKKTATALGQSKANSSRVNDRYRPHCISPGPDCLDVSVSHGMVRRALRILQALITGCERRGFDVLIRDKRTYVIVLGHLQQIRLSERLKQISVKHQWGDGVDHLPSGVLHLRHGHEYNTAGVSDKPQLPIEKQLNEFMLKLVRRAMQDERDREVYQERLARWKVHDLKRRKREQEQRSEALRQRRLRQLSTQWVRHQRWSTFVEEIERRVANDSSDVARLASAKRWVEWAKAWLTNTDAVEALLNDPWPDAPLPPEAGMPLDWQ